MPLHNFKRSKRLYNNFVHVFLLATKERLNVSYRRFVELAAEMGFTRMLCIKRIPHYTTLQKALQRFPKKLFEQMVRECSKALNLEKVEAGVDGTGLSNRNPSFYYLNRIDGKIVRNFTKTVLIADLNSKLVLNVRTHSDHSNETLDFIPLVKEVRRSLLRVLADKAYDSRKNREHCWKNGLDVHIPFRKFSESRKQEFGRISKRKNAEKMFNAQAYKRRALVESVNSALKRVFGSWVCSRKPENQCKQATLKILAYNLEIIGRKIKVWIFIN